MVFIAKDFSILLAKIEGKTFNDNQNDNKIEILGNVRKCELEELKVLRISKFAFDKMIYVAREAFKVKKSAVESYWILVGDKYVQDILIPEQSVSHGYVSVPIEGIMKISMYIRENKLKIMGWGHSHADFSVFFSGTDRGNQITVFNETVNYILNSRGELIKYCYGSTYNIHANVYAVLSYQREKGEVKSVEIGHEIIDDGRVFDPKIEEIDLSKLLIH